MNHMNWKNGLIKFLLMISIFFCLMMIFYFLFMISLNMFLLIYFIGIIFNLILLSYNNQKHFFNKLFISILWFPIWIVIAIIIFYEALIEEK